MSRSQDVGVLDIVVKYSCNDFSACGKNCSYMDIDGNQACETPALCLITVQPGLECISR